MRASVFFPGSARCSVKKTRVDNALGFLHIALCWQGFSSLRPAEHLASRDHSVSISPGRRHENLSTSRKIFSVNTAKALLLFLLTASQAQANRILTSRLEQALHEATQFGRQIHLLVFPEAQVDIPSLDREMYSQRISTTDYFSK